MSEVKDKALDQLEILVRQNKQLISMASRIQDPLERKKLLTRLERQIGQSQKLIKELK